MPCQDNDESAIRMIESRVFTRLQLCRTPTHFFEERVDPLRLAASNPDEQGQYGKKENSSRLANNLRLTRIFFVILALHFILVVGVCLFFDYHTRSREVPQGRLQVTSIPSLPDGGGWNLPDCNFFWPFCAPLPKSQAGFCFLF